MDCDCSDEYGPCEDHGTVVCQREGASTRTADELLEIFCCDALDIPGVETTPWGRDVLARVVDALATSDGYCTWLPADERGERLRDELVSLADQLESSLATLDEPISTFWGDGYVMVRMHDDCPLLEL